MPIPPDTVLSDPGTKRALRLWGAVALGPASWFVLLLAAYWKAGEKCVPIARGWLASWVAFTCLLSLASAVYARRRMQHEELEQTAPARRRSHFVAWFGWALGMYCVLISLALAVPLLAWAPCK